MHIKTDHSYHPREFPLHHLPASPFTTGNHHLIFIPQDSSLFWNFIKINDALFTLVCLAFSLQRKVFKIHSCVSVDQYFLFLAEQLSILWLYLSLSIPCSLTYGLLFILHCYKSSHYAHLCTRLFVDICPHFSWMET